MCLGGYKKVIFGSHSALKIVIKYTPFKMEINDWPSSSLLTSSSVFCNIGLL